MKTKKQLFKTAKARIGCAKFAAGEYVAIKFDFTDRNGTDWFLVTAGQSGKFEFPVAYPAKHLTDYVL